MNINLHNSDFRALPGVPNCCPNFSSGAGLGYSAGLQFSKYLSDKFFLMGRFGYSDNSALLKNIESEEISVDGIPETGEFEHTIEASLAGFEAGAFAGYRFLKNFEIILGAGVDISRTKEYSQKEEIIRPSNKGVFLDTESRTRNVNSGDLEDVRNSIWMTELSAVYSLPLDSDGKYRLKPQISYRMGLSNIIEDLDWKYSSIRLGLAFEYRKYDSQMPDERLIPVEESQKKVESDPGLISGLGNLDTARLYADADITAKGIIDGKEHDFAELKVEEFQSTEMHPLLNYVFFDKNSSKIPWRYSTLNGMEANRFDERMKYLGNTMNIYYELLNIIGQRMRRNFEAVLTITGCTAGDEDDKDLARARAEIVRDYLRDVWEIPESRMEINSRGLPEYPSEESDPDGIEENRRVELSSNKSEILEPVMIEDKLLEFTPPVIRFYPVVEGELDIALWGINIDFLLRGPITIEYGEGDFPKNIDWKIQDYRKPNYPFADTIKYYLEFETKAGDRYISGFGKSIPVRKRTVKMKKEERAGDKRIDRYNLILFGFDKTEPDERNLSIIDFINEEIEANSKVSVAGFTDRIGGGEYNLNLSKVRAENVAKMLRGIKAKVAGSGEEDLLYPNDLPEARFYCRTVEILVETPMKW